VSAEGTLADNVVTLTSRMTGPGGLSLTAAGRVGTTPAGPLDLTVQLNSVPASLANAFAAGLGAEGVISGSARVTGTVAAPQGTFGRRLARRVRGGNPKCRRWAAGR
jgi:translocation and assembly module TamB